MIINSLKGSISLKHAWIFVVFAGVICTFHNYHFFGTSQIDMLPIIYRQMDTSFLANDWYTNISVDYNEDFIFSKFILLLSQFLSVPFIFFSLTLIANVGIAAAAFLATMDLSRSNHIAGILAAILVVCMPTFFWGVKDIFIRPNLTPEHLIMPLILLAIWKGVRQKPLLVGLLAGLATLIHPLTGPGVGGLILLQIVITQLWFKRFNRKLITHVLLAGLILLLPLLLHIIPYLNSFDVRISDEYFVEIMKMRFPHHYLPSYFLTPKKTIIGLLFIITAAIAWNKWRRMEYLPKAVSYSVLPIATLLFLLCLFGWIFSEIVPTRLMYTLQPFRFLIILKFLGILMISFQLGELFSNSTDLKKKMIYGLAAFYPPVFLVVETVGVKLKSGLLLLLAITVFVSCAFWYPIHTLELFFALLLLLLFLYYSPKLFASGLSVLLLFILFNNLYTSSKNDSKFVRILTEKFVIAYDYDDIGQEAVALSDFIRENTPAKSKLLVPPRAGAIRITTNRALVIDAFSMPMNDRGIREWMYRMNQVYNRNSESPLREIRETIKNYNLLIDSDLLELRDQFNCNYAVFPSDYSTTIPVIYINSKYKLLQL